MKELLSALILLALVGSVAWATAPDPDACSVGPADVMGIPRVIGVLDQPTASSYADIDIYVRNIDGLPIPGAFVEVNLETGAGCVTPSNDPVICFCENTVFTGFTNAAGYVQINGGFGGCCLEPGAAVIIADGVPIREMVFVSPDWNGEKGDCEMGLPDFTVFGTGWSTGAGGCTDYDGDDTTAIGDFTVFGAAWTKFCTEAP